ncbi:hypothetical protein MINTMi27_15840 [Mycobacterium intracellulare]|nr:hypothetical protein [Mycobacterium intracellulare]BCP41491.1 hypothetical protein MINTMi27_15840 [Mycobacterium intracellulare]
MTVHAMGSRGRSDVTFLALLSTAAKRQKIVFGKGVALRADGLRTLWGAWWATVKSFFTLLPRQSPEYSMALPRLFVLYRIL